MAAPHALVIPFPAQGHIGPMMHLSIHLASHGFFITFVTTQFNIPLLRRLLPLLRRLRLPIRLSEVVDDLRPSGDTTGSSSIVELCASFFSIVPAFEDLIQNHQQTAADGGGAASGEMDMDALIEAAPLTCIVSDLYLHFTQDLAHKFGLKHLVFWTAGAGMLANTMALIAHGRPLPPDPEDFITWIPGVPPLKRRHINAFLLNPHPQDLMYSIYAQSYRRLSDTNLVAINTFEALESASLAALRSDNAAEILAIGPLLPPPYFTDSASTFGADAFPTAALWPEDHQGCISWLSTQAKRSVLYVSFGSIAVMSGEQLAELAEGLAESGAAVLWVMRPDLLTEASGGDAVMERFRQRMGGGAYVTEWAPQLRVLSHPSVGGFLSHCGWNSTLESLAAGVPVIGWPYFADQMLNSRCLVEKWGCGAEFLADEDGIFRRREISAVVRRVMSADPAADGSSQPLLEAALQWRSAARSAACGDSAAAFSRLIRAMQ